jgi:hypothetical protein
MSVSANLIINGDFESPDLNGVFPVYLPAGNSAVTGWTIGGANGVTIHHVSENQPYWNPPQNSTQWLDLTGNGGGAYIEQSFATIINTPYLVTFDTFNGSLNYSGGNPQATGFKVEATGNPLLNVAVTPGTAAIISYYFTATSLSTTLRFTELTGFDSNAGWIDNVSVVAVPEPATVVAGALLLLPFGASIIRIVRKNRSA